MGEEVKKGKTVRRQSQPRDRTWVSRIVGRCFTIWATREVKKTIGDNRRLDIPGASEGKESACNAGILGSVPWLERSPGEGNVNPLAVLLPGKFHGWRSLAGYSVWDCQESDTTERLHFRSF